jgi:hypothetical protein
MLSMENIIFFVLQKLKPEMQFCLRFTVYLRIIPSPSSRCRILAFSLSFIIYNLQKMGLQNCGNVVVRQLGKNDPLLFL